MTNLWSNLPTNVCSSDVPHLALQTLILKNLTGFTIFNVRFVGKFNTLNVHLVGGVGGFVGTEVSNDYNQSHHCAYLDLSKFSALFCTDSQFLSLTLQPLLAVPAGKTVECKKYRSFQKDC